MSKTPLRSLPAFVCLLLPVTIQAQPPDRYERVEVSIPMRDRVALHAVVLRPVDPPGPLPILLVRTPFGAARELPDATPPAPFAELAKDGYIFVIEDVRGRSGSGGQFITLRTLARRGGIDESTDAWDTIDWLVSHLPNNNGKVGMLGISYRGWLAAVAAVHPHPALRAISPQVPMADVWMGDDFFHQGAFRQTQGVLYSGFIEGDGVTLPDGDPYETYLHYSTLGALARAAGVDSLPSWVAFRDHPAYDSFWKARALPNILARSEIPTLFVGAAWDEEDILGAQLMYRTLERTDRRQQNHFVLGPWSHTTSSRGSGDSLGPIPLGEATAEWYRRTIERPWFAYHLHGIGTGQFPEAWVYETNARRWRTFDRWPPPAARPKRLYLQAGGALSFAPPTTAAACQAFTSDPAHPVPNAPPGEGGPENWLLADQRLLAGRADVVSWRSEPLTEDLVIAGDVTARLVASTTGADADWVVKLIDVYPDGPAEHPELSGYQLMVSADVLRGRYREGFTRARPVAAERPLPYTIDLHQQLYRFRRGHRFMVQVQSSWFPMYDRNPQTFVPNIFAAPASAYRAQKHCVWQSAGRSSYLSVGVLPESPEP